MVVITIYDIILISIITISIIVFIFTTLFLIFIDKYKEKSKKWHNCFECQNYYLSSSAGLGDYRYDTCQITGVEDRNNFYSNTKYRKCKNFKSIN